MNLNAHYCLAPGVVIRPERFGGLIYRHDNRRLYFLHSHELVAFLAHLDGQQTLGTATDVFLAAHDLPAHTREELVAALEHLEHLQVLATREDLEGGME